MNSSTSTTNENRRSYESHLASQPTAKFSPAWLDGNVKSEIGAMIQFRNLCPTSSRALARRESFKVAAISKGRPMVWPVELAHNDPERAYFASK